MEPLFWNLDTRAVSTERYTQADPAFDSTRGDEAVQVLLLQGTPAAPVLLAAGATVGIVVRPASNPKQGYLAGPTVLAPGASAAAGYTGTTSTDTVLTRTVMNVDPANPAAELTSYGAEAAFYYVPAGGGDPVESLPFALSIVPNYYRPLDPPAQNAPGYPVDGGSPSSVYANANLDGGTP